MRISEEQTGQSFFRQVIFILALAFCLPVGFVHATHIMGGTMTYEQISSGNYNIKLLLYFDMINGSPGAMDTATMVTVFDAGTQQPITILTLDLTYAIQATCASACGYCVNMLSYTKNNVALQVPPAGVKLVYERCCRSNVLQNIQDPGSRGLFISTCIPAIANTSAVFTSPVPPVFLAFTANTFDASATDADGDELTYRLDDMYYGSASSTQPIPSQYSFSSPVGPWQSLYSTTNMLGGSQPLQINSSTGQITANPGVLGFFQIAYLVEEHRNGQLISETRNEAMVLVVEGSNPCLMVSAPEASSAINVRIYPNPAANKFTVGLSGIENTQPVHVEIFNLLGQSVLTHSYAAGINPEIDMHDFPIGSYVVQTTFGDKRFTQKLILKR